MKVSIVIGLIAVIKFLLTVIINNFGIIFLLTNGISLNINICYLLSMLCN